MLTYTAPTPNSYWAIGVAPSLDSADFESIRAKLVSASGVASNFSEPNDAKFYRMYGYEVLNSAELTF